MPTTKFRVWLRDPRIQPVWTGVKLVGPPKYVKEGCIEVTVEGNGSDLQELIAKRRDIFAAYLQMKPEKAQGSLAILEPPPQRTTSTATPSAGLDRTVSERF